MVTAGVCTKCLWQRRPAGSCNRLGHACSGGSPSQCLQRQWLACGGSGSPAPCAQFNSGALLLWCPGLLPQTFPAVELLTPVPSGCLFIANSCPLPGSMLQNPLSRPSPPLQQETHDSGQGVQDCGTDHVCSSYFVLPSTDHLLRSLLMPRRSLSVSADIRTVRGFF